VGEREPAPRRQLSIRSAGDRKHCAVMLHASSVARSWIAVNNSTPITSAS
jgi:hypothetical protein